MEQPAETDPKSAAGSSELDPTSRVFLDKLALEKVGAYSLEPLKIRRIDTMGQICGVMRVEKRKRDAVYGLQEEANRTLEDHLKGRDFERSDIDWTLTDQNQHMVYTKNWGKEISRQIKEAGIKEVMKGKNRSVVMLDGLYTASPEWFETHHPEEHLKYFQACLRFHTEQYCGGDPSRVINAVIHLDETTPHMQVASVPILDTGVKQKLSAKDIMGNMKDYRRRQDLFYEEVSQHFGMERGEVVEEGEIRLHTTKREWQIATQEEKLEAAKQKVEVQEQKIEQNADTIKQQEAEIKKKKEQIKKEPHVLTKQELESIKEDARPANKLTGKVTLPQEEYQSLLATRMAAENLAEAQKEVEREREQLEKEQQHMEIEREDTLEAARQEGLRRGDQKQQELVRKGQAYEQMVRLMQEDEELARSFQRAIVPRYRQYPILVEMMMDVFEWIKDMVQKMTVKFR